MSLVPLKPYAIQNDRPQRRLDNNEKTLDHDIRSPFQHDRDRILHSSAFRRLQAKTQVVGTHENDHSRTRLSHSLEVAQISESIAIHFGLNRFAVIAMALGHDLGHAPFGHIGRTTFSETLKDFGLNPFRHNYQGLLGPVFKISTRSE